MYASEVHVVVLHITWLSFPAITSHNSRWSVVWETWMSQAWDKSIFCDFCYCWFLMLVLWYKVMQMPYSGYL